MFLVPSCLYLIFLSFVLLENVSNFADDILFTVLLAQNIFVRIISCGKYVEVSVFQCSYYSVALFLIQLLDPREMLIIIYLLKGLVYQYVFKKASVSSYVSMRDYQTNNLSKVPLPAIFIVIFLSVMHFPIYKKQNEQTYKIMYQDIHSIVKNRRYLNLGRNTVLRSVFTY